jgi:hypothetical protein
MSGSFGKPQGGTRVTDLRASLKAMSAPPPPLEKRPPKPRKVSKNESEEERWAKAEQLAMLQHTTSLLDHGKKKSKKPYVRVGERPEKKKGGLIFQLLLVMIVVFGVAWYLDPTLVPQEWTDRALETINSWMPAENA